MRMRLFATVLAAAFGLTGSAASEAGKVTPPAARTQPTFFISGHGWGHGLGLSQYGAYGYAQHGWKYDRILKQYYPGRTIGPATVKRVRVLLGDGLKRVTISSKSPFQVVGADGSKYPLEAGAYTVGPAFKLADPTGPQAKPQSLTYPLEFRTGPQALALNGRAYRGSLRVLKVGTAKIRIVNVVDLDF